MTAAVEIRAVTRRFGTTAALDAVDLSVAAGEFAVLLGPAGCGKTTLLNILGGFLAPDAGAVLLDGRAVTKLPPAKRPTTTLFQDDVLFPHMTVRQNVGFGLRMRGRRRRARDAKADEMLALVGLPDAGPRRPHELSGEQRRRAALARALAVEPEVLLLDEPLEGLEPARRRALRAELKAMQQRLGTTVIHVTRDHEEAMVLADRIAVLNAGRIEDQGRPGRLYRRPASCFAAGAMGEINLVPARVGGTEPGTLLLDTALGPMRLARKGDLGMIIRGTRLSLGFRPENLAPGGSGIAIPCTVTETRFLGTHHRVHVKPRPAGPPLTAHLPNCARPRPGETLILRLAPDAAMLLPES